MGAVKKITPLSNYRISSVKSSHTALNLIQGSFSNKRILRKFPLLAGLHRTLDGALLGVLVAFALMSTLALHWQHLWTVAFTRLESTRQLSHKLIESTAMIDKHLLNKTRLPLSMVPTKASNLLYLNTPESFYSSKSDLSNKFDSLDDFVSYPASHGY